MNTMFTPLTTPGSEPRKAHWVRVLMCMGSQLTCIHETNPYRPSIQNQKEPPAPCPHPSSAQSWIYSSSSASPGARVRAACGGALPLGKWSDGCRIRLERRDSHLNNSACMVRTGEPVRTYWVAALGCRPITIGIPTGSAGGRRLEGLRRAKPRVTD